MRLVYDLCMLAGAALFVAGAAVAWGLGASLMAAGMSVMVLTRLAVGVR
jgi:hypothetical protein